MYWIFKYAYTFIDIWICCFCITCEIGECLSLRAETVLRWLQKWSVYIYQQSNNNNYNSCIYIYRYIGFWKGVVVNTIKFREGSEIFLRDCAVLTAYRESVEEVFWVPRRRRRGGMCSSCAYIYMYGACVFVTCYTRGQKEPFFAQQSNNIPFIQCYFYIYTQVLAVYTSKHISKMVFIAFEFNFRHHIIYFI